MDRTRLFASILFCCATLGCAMLGCATPLETPATTQAVDPAAATDEATSSSSVEAKGLLPRLFGGSLSSASPSSTQPAIPQRPQPPKGQKLYEKLLFYPTKHPAGQWEPAGLKFEDVHFASTDGTKLHGWFCPCDDPQAVLLYCHGNGGNVSFDAELFTLLQQELRVATFAFDYRGYGKSEGLPNVVGVLEDARAARTWLAKRTGVAETDVVLMGRSLGGAVVVQLAADASPRAVVLESTFTSLKDAAAHHFPRLAWLVPKNELNSAVTLAAYAGPLLQSHGDADRTIPFTQGESLFATAKGKKQFFRVSGGDHNDPQPATYYQRLEKFLTDLP